MTKIWTELKARASHLRRISVVYAVELRLTIVTELYMRPMSPKQFFEEFGGGSVPRVDSHFKTLAKHGWLELIRRETGGSRYGATEHFYRATELAVFDHKTWSVLPYSIKVTFSWKSFKQLGERVRVALKAGTFDVRADRHLSWTPFLLDQLGWERVIAAVDALFESFSELQADAKLRIANSGEQSILATAALAAFESAPRRQDRNEWRVTPSVVAVTESAIPLMLRLSKVFADEICLRIMAELNLRPMSVPQFHREFGDELGGVSLDCIRGRFKKLVELDWLKKVGEKKGEGRRGPAEHLYRATRPAIFDNPAWAEVPGAIKATYSWTTFDQLSEQVKMAMEAGAFDARSDRHLTWSLLRLDQAGLGRGHRRRRRRVPLPLRGAGSGQGPHG